MDYYHLKAVIFDIDGTLIQSMEADAEIYKSVVFDILGPVDFRPSFSDYEDVTNIGVLQELMVDNSISVEIELLEQLRQTYVEGLQNHFSSCGPFPEVPGAQQALNSLRASPDHCVAIATGGYRDSAILKLETSGFDLTDIPIVTCDDSISRTEIMKIALSQLGQECDSITYYGDGDWDQRACQHLGWQFVPVGPVLNGIASYEVGEFI